MRNIIFSVAIAVGSSALLFLLSTAVGLPADVAKGVATVPALAIKSIYDFLEQQSAKRTLAHAKSLVSFEEFAMHPLSMFVLAVIMFVGIVNFTGFVTGFLVGASMSQHRDLAQSQPLLIFDLITVTSLPLNFIGISYIGRWIGYRSRPLRGLAVAIASTVIGILANSLVIVYGMPLLQSIQPTNELLAGEVIQKLTFHEFILNARGLIMLGSLYIIAISLGVWWGQRARFARYLAFILKVLPPETRQTIVEIARDETLRASRDGVLAAPEAVRA